MPERVDITLNINGREYAVRVEPRRTLVDVIRDDCGQTGTHIGCEHGVCGACTIILDNEAVRSCLMFAVQARRQAHPHRRGTGRRRQVAPAAERLHHASWLAVRVLHAGFPDAGHQRIETNPDITDEEILEVLVVQSLPLHRLPEHHQGGAQRGRRDGAPDAR